VRLVTDRVVSVSAVVSVCLACLRGWRCYPMCRDRHRLRPYWAGSFRVAKTRRPVRCVRKAYSRCQLARKASFQGQVRLIFKSGAGVAGQVIGWAGATAGAQRVWLEILEVVIVARLFVRAGSPAGDCLAVMRGSDRRAGAPVP
jgi:hypothetical protein